jgi:5-carboxymethyl-2-hydroxymuconate isomerase
MLHLCSIVVAILKMETGRNFLMLGINSGHHYLSTYKMLMISDNVEFVRYSSSRHFQNGHYNTAEIQHCPISTTFHIWVDYDVPNLLPTLKKFSMSGINSGHHNLPTYEMSLKSDNVEFVRYCGGHFENGEN